METRTINIYGNLNKESVSNSIQNDFVINSLKRLISTKKNGIFIDSYNDTVRINEIKDLVCRKKINDTFLLIDFDLNNKNININIFDYFSVEEVENIFMNKFIDKKDEDFFTKQTRTYLKIVFSILKWVSLKRTVSLKDLVFIIENDIKIFNLQSILRENAPNFNPSSFYVGLEEYCMDDSFKYKLFSKSCKEEVLSFIKPYKGHLINEVKEDSQFATQMGYCKSNLQDMINICNLFEYNVNTDDNVKNINLTDVLLKNTIVYFNIPDSPLDDSSEYIEFLISHIVTKLLNSMVVEKNDIKDLFLLVQNQKNDSKSFVNDLLKLQKYLNIEVVDVNNDF